MPVSRIRYPTRRNDVRKKPLSCILRTTFCVPQQPDIGVRPGGDFTIRISQRLEPVEAKVEPWASPMSDHITVWSIVLGSPLYTVFLSANLTINNRSILREVRVIYSFNTVIVVHRYPNVFSIVHFVEITPIDHHVYHPAICHSSILNCIVGLPHPTHYIRSYPANGNHSR